jgi:ABC-type transport system involved in cytochrome c biogenesis permease subunit
MFILVGSMVIVDLRILGLVGRRLHATQLADWLLPWMWISLAFNFLSGFLMFAGSAPSYYNNSIFYDKMTIILLAVAANILVQQKIRKWDLLPAIPAWAKLLAVVSIGLWVGAIIAGVEVPALTGVG